MADSNSSLVISGVAAVAAVGSAVVAFLQARSAKRQAEESASQAYHASTSAIAAKQQAEAAEKQVAIAEKQLQLLGEQVAQESFSIVVKAQFVQRPYLGENVWMLDIGVENHSKQEAEIQRVAILVSSGGASEWVPSRATSTGRLRLDNERGKNKLPAKLGPGEAGSFVMYEYPEAKPNQVVAGAAPIDWSQEKWRPVKGLLVRANHKDFVVTDGEWRKQIETEYFKLSPPKGSV